IHTIAMKRKTEEATPEKAQAFAEEGRLMALELMGYLVSFYRHRSIGAGKPTFQVPAEPKPI
ncbi:response regulator, partial [Acidobacteria bacterium AH-259-L09]|nr:response regulator [Acidobacteria bacterium AH-259-L09]